MLQHVSFPFTIVVTYAMRQNDVAQIESTTILFSDDVFKRSEVSSRLAVLTSSERHHITAPNTTAKLYKVQ
jgi:hypothetical protein